MNNIIVRVRGGLGNQLFQYAYAVALRNENPKYKIILDTREFAKYYWPFELDRFNLSDTEIYSDKKFKNDASVKFFHVYQRLYSMIKGHTYETSNRLIKKGKLYTGTFSPEIRKYDGRDIYLYGYFQDASVLEPIRKELSEIFTVKNLSESSLDYSNKIRPDSIAVSVRFARQEEIANNEKFVYGGFEDYKKCIEYIKEKRGNVQLVVFSNNIDKIKSDWQLGDLGSDVLYIENCSATEQIELMRKCNDFILANSTFSWWGAFLGAAEKDSIILAPRIWYEGKDIDETKLRFSGFTTMESVIK